MGTSSSFLAANPSRDLSAVRATDKVRVLGADGLDYWCAAGQVPIVANYATLSAITGVAGQIVKIPKLAGVGTIMCEWVEATARWAVCAGESITNITDPFSVVSAASTSPVNYTLATIPAGMIGDGETWEIESPIETVTNTGNDAIEVMFGTAVIISASVAPNLMVPALTRYSRFGTIFSRVLGILMSSVLTAKSKLTVDLSIAQDFIFRITPGAISNTSYVRAGIIRRVA